MRNWSRNVTFGSSTMAQPTSIDEVQGLVAGATRIKPLGSRHSFNSVADTSGTHVSLDQMPRQITVHDSIARIPAALTYAEAGAALMEQGWAFHNLASLPHITVAGSVATGTHGSGDRLGTLASAVVGLEMVLPDGELVTWTTADEFFPGTVVALGALGVVVAVHVRVEPHYEMAQWVSEDVHLDTVLGNFDTIFSAATSVSWFTPWGPELTGALWCKQKMPAHAPAVPGTFAGGKRHPVPHHDPIHCTPQEGEPGPYLDRLPHFLRGFTPSSGEELQTEYLIDRVHVSRALRAVADHRDVIAPLLQITEVRTMTADEQWLSGASGRNTVGVHFTWKDVPEVYSTLPLIDELLREHDGRPHWGKLFYVDATSPLSDRYSRWNDFVTLRESIDPAKKFTNDFLDAVGIS